MMNVPMKQITVILRLLAQTTRVHSFVPVMKAGKAQEMFALISTNVLLMNIHAIHMVSVPMLMLLSNVNLDTLVMVSFALTSTNASKRMPVMLILLVTILLVLMSAHDTLVKAVMVNPVLIMTNA